MANVLPEVRPLVESMPHEGFVMQTGGSARRSTIKNNGFDHYFVHGVPGHTHNASAMMSVSADYSRQLEEPLTIHGEWADENVVLAVGQYTDSVEPDDASELYDRAIERGIGTITLIPENCQHIIQEPTRSISEIRTIVSGKDRLSTLTYVNNEFGWVDPVSGETRAFTSDPQIDINIFGYPNILGDLGTDGIPTLDQPVYIGNRADEFYRYSIASRGSDTPGGAADWDGNVRFYWDSEKRVYSSKPFTKYFKAFIVQSQYIGTQQEIGTGPHQQFTIQASATLAAAIANNALAAGADIGVIPQNQLHVHGVDGLGFKSGRLEVAAGHDAPPNYIAQADFKVNFPSWSTQRAENGTCLFSRAPHEVLYNDIPKFATDYAFAFVARRGDHPELPDFGAFLVRAPGLPHPGGRHLRHPGTSPGQKARRGVRWQFPGQLLGPTLNLLRAYFEQDDAKPCL